MLKSFNVRGSWNSGARVLLTDYVEGFLVAEDPEGNELSGPPETFHAFTGESGVALLERILPAPTVLELEYGAIREALASVHSVALYGFGETRAWDGNTYTASDGCGNEGVIRFALGECTGAAACKYEVGLNQETALEHVPAKARSSAREILALPLLCSNGSTRATSLFWSEEGKVCSGAPWHVTYARGAELFRHELLDDRRWLAEACALHELTDRRGDFVLQVAKEMLVAGSAHQLALEAARELIPVEAPYREEASVLLTAIGNRV